MTLEVCLQSDGASPEHTEAAPIPRMAYNKRDAAATISIKVRKLDYLIESGELEVRRIGTRVVITHQALQRFLRRDHTKPFLRIDRKKARVQ
jgi:hypothetical protein